MKQAINLVENIEGELLVSHRVIAEQTNNKEKSVLDLITRNLAELEEFGMVRFKIVAIKNAKNRVNEEKTYYLNEPQTTLLLTFLRNNEVVKKFKVRLVTEFFKMRNLLQNSSFPNLKKLEERAKLLEISRQEYKIFEDVFFRLGITRPEELAITCNRAVKKRD
jgi:phage regulator Rha-like protein